MDEERFWSKVDKRGANECWLWTGAISHGYGAFNVGRLNSVAGRTRRAHRIAWALTNGPAPEGMDLCHRCDVRACCNPGHLFVGTRRDNMLDCVAKDRHACGDRHGMRRRPELAARGERAGPAKLTAQDVDTIRKCYAADCFTHDRLAAAFGVSARCIGKVIKRESWAHLG